MEQPTDMTSKLIVFCLTGEASQFETQAKKDKSVENQRRRQKKKKKKNQNPPFQDTRMQRQH